MITWLGYLRHIKEIISEESCTMQTCMGGNYKFKHRVASVESSGFIQVDSIRINFLFHKSLTFELGEKNTFS